MKGRERLKAALSSARDLNRIIGLLDEGELREALELESAGMRRSAIIERLIVRITRLVEDKTREELQKEYAPWLENSQ